ncbi:multiple epidermal growth factor-like domains protein 10 isoform X1 [Lineus longissimus]|uniref:multiple epidermal growth factor-like domains protein 10 isoform X1 n=1 Tax=Lineus longissimus TaxID=88925 RepID=UPI00315CFCE4
MPVNVCRDMLCIFTLVTGLMCYITGIEGSKVVTTDTILDPSGEGVCNETRLVEKNVITAVSYVTSRQTRYKTCGLGCFGGSWCAWCSTKYRTVYMTAYRMDTRPTMIPAKVLSCCEGYVKKDRECRPDCMTSKLDCTKNCTNCSNDQSYCNHVTGVCHCKYGYYHHGNGCQSCPTGWYGQNCTHTCQCQVDQSCDPQSGVCAKSCEPGKAGTTCNDTCEPQRWGEECAKSCDCSSYPCDSITGACLCGAARTGERCENATSNPSEADQQTNINNAGSYVIIPVVSVLGVLIIAMVIIGVVFYRKRKMVKRHETAGNGTESVNAAYSPDSLSHSVLSPSGEIDNSYMRENDIYSPGCDVEMVEYDKLNFQGRVKKSGQGHSQGQDQNIYSSPQTESHSSGMVENDLYSMD